MIEHDSYVFLTRIESGKLKKVVRDHVEIYVAREVKDNIWTSDAQSLKRSAEVLRIGADHSLRDAKLKRLLLSIFERIERSNHRRCTRMFFLFT